MPPQDEFQEPIPPLNEEMLGASGDLVARKFVPALYNLFLIHRLPATLGHPGHRPHRLQR